MARKFGPQHMKSGYAAMAGSKQRPIFRYTNRNAKNVGLANASKKK